MNSKLSLQILYWSIVAGILFGIGSNIMPVKDALIGTLINLTFYAAIFYINTGILFPKYYSGIGSSKYLIACIILVSLFTLGVVEFEYWLANTSDRIPKHVDHPKLFMSLRNLFWFTLMLLVGSVYMLQQRLRQHLLVHKEIEQEKVNTELKLLRSQINPHFLFNALNNIYSLSYLKSDKAPESILKLSGMLRYVIEDCVAETVPLKSEIEYIENYISLQQMKSPEEQNILFDYSGTNNSVHIAPMLFIPFIENSFKYSKIEDSADAYIKISLSTPTNQSLIFTIRNSFPLVGKPISGLGTGIRNVKQRLNIIYPNKHILSIEEKENIFIVTLKIDFHEA